MDSATRSIVNHLRVLIVIMLLATIGGLYIAVMTQLAVTRASDAVVKTAEVVNRTNNTVLESHELITKFLEDAKQPIIRGAENSDAIRANSAELTVAMRIVLQKVDALEQRADRFERVADTSQAQISELLNIVHNPLRNIFNRLRTRKE